MADPSDYAYTPPNQPNAYGPFDSAMARARGAKRSVDHDAAIQDAGIALDRISGRQPEPEGYPAPPTSSEQLGEGR